jgi:hypothetical protein
MSTSDFKIISDGNKLILLNGAGPRRDRWLFDNPFLTSYSVNIHGPMTDYSVVGGKRMIMPDLLDLSINLTLRGGFAHKIDQPLIMGVDIFDKLSVVDYLDVINEKIKAR